MLIFQAWALTGRGEIRSDDLCLTAGAAFAMDNSVRYYIHDQFAIGRIPKFRPFEEMRSW